jgi:hypothetical protein
MCICIPDTDCGTASILLCPIPHTGVAQAQATAVAEAVYQALTCNCACEGPTAQALSSAAAKADGCGSVAQALAGECKVPCF